MKKFNEENNTLHKSLEMNPLKEVVDGSDEVQDDGPTVGTDENIRRFEAAVNHAAGVHPVDRAGGRATLRASARRGSARVVATSPSRRPATT